jgi:hypothetical protein
MADVPRRPDHQTAAPLTPSSVPPHAAHAGTPVNPASRAVNPRLQYPRHVELLLLDLATHGQRPEEWQIIAADEVRFTDHRLDVEFTLVRTGTNAVLRRRVEVDHGRLLRISERILPGDETQAATIIPVPPGG